MNNRLIASLCDDPADLHPLTPKAWPRGSWRGTRGVRRGKGISQFLNSMYKIRQTGAPSNTNHCCKSIRNGLKRNLEKWYLVLVVDETNKECVRPKAIVQETWKHLLANMALLEEYALMLFFASWRSKIVFAASWCANCSCVMLSLLLLGLYSVVSGFCTCAAYVCRCSLQWGDLAATAATNWPAAES